jgi:hypothetical protein
MRLRGEERTACGGYVHADSPRYFRSNHARYARDQSASHSSESGVRKTNPISALITDDSHALVFSQMSFAGRRRGNKVKKGVQFTVMVVGEFSPCKGTLLPSQRSNQRCLWHRADDFCQYLVRIRGLASQNLRQSRYHTR